jgi:hypothetical protein
VQREYMVTKACDEIVPIIHRELDMAGFHVEQSFDLRSALALVPTCTCPHHGTALCDCQYNVLLIYGQAQAPATLVVHGHDRQCWIGLATDPNGQLVQTLVADIVQALTVAQLIAIDEADGAAHQAATL